VHGIYLSAQASLLCMFTAENKEVVHAAARLAQVPFTQVDAVPASPLTDPRSNDVVRPGRELPRSPTQPGHTA
jgi:hypothetical protein